MKSAHHWSGGPHPWKEWRNWPEHLIWWRHLPPGVHALTDGVANTWHNIDELQVERRYSTRHEQQHIIERHDGCVKGTVEARVHYRTARWLAPDPHKVAAAIVEAGGDLIIAADLLWLPERGIRARLDARFMHPAERAIIHGKLNEELHP